MTTRNVQKVPIDLIDPGDNDRQDFDPRELFKLAMNIKKNGLAQPITLRRRGERFQIVAGERRYRAVSEILHRKTIDAIVHDEMGDEKASAIMLAENTSRTDLNPIEEARAYQKRIDQFAWSIEQVAEHAGVSEDLVKRRLKLLELVPELQHLIRHGNFPIGHAELISSLDNNRQRIAIRIYQEYENPPSLNRFREAVNRLLADQNQESMFDLGQFWLEQKVEEAPLPLKGKEAVTGAPVRYDPPPVRYKSTDAITDVMDRYIADLLNAGHLAEAGAIGNLFNFYVRHNWTSVPDQSPTRAARVDDTVAVPPEQRIK